jgi:hypothetical protein
MLTSLSEGTITQMGLPPTRAIKVFRTTPGEARSGEKALIGPNWVVRV